MHVDRKMKLLLCILKFIKIITTQFWRNKMSDLENKQNNYLEEYIEYYCYINKPGYAVLVTGAWGVGKTFQVKKFFKDRKENKQAYYVSLFGIKSAEDIISSVYVAMCPKKTMIKDALQKAEDISNRISNFVDFGLLGFTASLAGAFLRQEISIDKPLIFDDIERCGVNLKEILGIINLYTEHHGCNVIVIANEGELEGDVEGEGKSEFSKSKEKTFGKTIIVKSDVNAAYNAFIELISEKNEREILKSNRKAIIDIFIESEVKSLRILKYLLFDLARLIKCLGQDHLKNTKSLTEMFMLFSAFHIEWNLGRLPQEDLFDRQKSSVEYLFKKDKSEFELSGQGIVPSNLRYQGIRLTDTLLNDDALKEMLVDGVFNPETIQSSLDDSRFFLKENISKPWWIVANFESLEDEIVNDGFNRMNLEFDNREIIDTGEILHVFALKLMMSSKGISPQSIDDVSKECWKYIDDLNKIEKFLLDDYNGKWYFNFEKSAYGFCYLIHDDYKENFYQLYKHLTSSIECAYTKSLQKQSPELLGLLRDDAKKFRKLICNTANEKNFYATVPVLAWLKPREFVDAWMSAPKENWYWISIALRDRNYLGVPPNLNLESDWLNEVINLLNCEESKKDGFASIRIKRAIELVQGKYKNTSPPRT